MLSNGRICLIIYTLRASSFIKKEIDVNLEMQQKDIKAPTLQNEQQTPH